MKKKILIIVGTRPNFVKITQFKKIALQYPDIEIRILHTSQHSQHNMADIFFEQFGVQPDYFLDLESATPAGQIGQIIIGLEVKVREYKPDLMLVVGDVNSTLAGAIVANKLGVKLAHLESGLRSGDKTMPEEINRILTDQVTDYFFITEKSGVNNLIREGLSHNHHFVGNTMIDTLVAFEDQIQLNPIIKNLKLERKGYALMTIHRPATVDNPNELRNLIKLIETISQDIHIVFPIHPRTINKLKSFGLYEKLNSIKGLLIVEPLSYFPFQKLIADCLFIITDSGGIQEESTFRGIPCLTLRPSTERPVTVEVGTNELITFDFEKIATKVESIKKGDFKEGRIPELWDGKATDRILKIIDHTILT